MSLGVQTEKTGNYDKENEIMPTINELREKTGLSQREFAQKYHIKVGTLQHWEQGVAKAPETVLYLLEKVINYESKQ